MVFGVSSICFFFMSRGVGSDLYAFAILIQKIYLFVLNKILLLFFNSCYTFFLVDFYLFDVWFYLTRDWPWTLTRRVVVLVLGCCSTDLLGISLSFYWIEVLSCLLVWWLSGFALHNVISFIEKSPF